MDHAKPAQLAAILYEDAATVEALMQRFAEALQAAGVDVCGVIQLPPTAAGCGPEAPMCLRDLRSGAVTRICQDLGRDATGCRLDTAAMAAVAARLRQQAETPSDIIFISKFGKQEAAGAGFRDEIAHAVQEGRTVITAVKHSLLPDWLQFTGGIGTVLEAQPWVLQDWWRRLRDG